MLQPESPNYPHTLAQWVYILLATFVGGGGLGAWLTAWLRRKHGPAEVRKINAEARSIEIRDELAVGDTVVKLVREVAQATVDAERRRDEWIRREDELRTQVVFWRNKAEELDGELVSEREEKAQHETRARLHEYQIKKLKALLSYHNISYAELDHPRE